MGYISCGKLNKKNIYIVLSVVCLVLEAIAFGNNYNNSFRPLLDLEQEPTNGTNPTNGSNNTNVTNLTNVTNQTNATNQTDEQEENSGQAQEIKKFSEHFLINNIFSYSFTFILSFILYKIERKNLGRNSLKEKDNEENSSLSTIKYIHNVSNNVYLSNKALLLFLIIILLWIIIENLIKLFSFLKLKDLDFWMFEIIIITYLIKIKYKKKIYLHHKVIIFLNLIIVALFKIIAIILSFADDCNKSNDYFYSYNYNYTSNNFNMCLSEEELKSFNENNTEYNLTGGLKHYYVKNFFFFAIGIIGYLIVMTLRSYINLEIKEKMDVKYISEKKILILYGLMGATINFIICIITTFVKCKDKTKDRDIYDYICKVKYNDTLYFDSFIAFFKPNYNPLILILKTIFGSIFFSLNRYFSILIIKNFTPVHLIFTFPIYFLILKIFLIIFTLVKEQSFFSNNRMHFIEWKFSLDFLEEILSSIGFLVYLEIIELNFCKLNYNLKRNISDRGDEEKYGYIGVGDEDADEDKDKKDKEMENASSN